ncbi:hypothetical protein ES705_45101 [subsurface metagenome]
MKIEKAIELLVLEASGSPDINQGDLSSAQRLGIEALDAIKTLRQSQALGLLSQLPGETKGGHDES